MKEWIKEIIIGVVLLVIGGVIAYFKLGDVITVLIGGGALMLIVLGILFIIIGWEDKALEKELAKLEEELKKELEESEEKS